MSTSSLQIRHGRLMGFVRSGRRDRWAEATGKPIIDDELWTRIEPLLPPSKPRRFKYPGRKPVAGRAALTGILFVPKTGIRWRDSPCEMGCGTGAGCWRRLRDWQQTGVWGRLHAVLLAKPRAAGKIDFSRVVVDSSSIRAVAAGEKLARIPPIERVPGRRTTSPSTPTERRSQQSRPARIVTTLPNGFR